MADTPAWFDKDHYLQSKVEQLNTIEFEDRTDWTLEEVTDLIGDDAYGHFVAFGNSENVSPSPFFDAQFYLEQKAAQLSAEKYQGHENWTVEAVQYAFDQAGLTAWDHFNAHGWTEGLNPSESFNVALYLADKAADLNEEAYEGRTDWTAEDVQEAFAANGLSPIAHYAQYGKDEGLTPKTAADAGLVELSNRLDAVKAADAEVEAYLKATPAFEVGEDEVEAGEATAEQVKQYYTQEAGQFDTLVDGFAELDADVQDAFIAAEQTRLQSVVDSEKADLPSNMEALLKAAAAAGDSLVAALKTRNAATSEEAKVKAALEAYHDLTLIATQEGYDPAADNSANWYYVDGKVLQGQDGSTTAVAFDKLKEVADDQYATALMEAAAALTAASNGVTSATKALENAVAKVYLAENEAHSVDAETNNFYADETPVISIVDGEGAEAVTVDFDATLQLNKTKADAENDVAFTANAGDAADLSEALAAQKTFADNVATFQEARGLREGLVELEDAARDARLAITNETDDADIPGLDIELIDLNADNADRTPSADAEVFLFSDNASDELVIQTGFGEDDLIFFGKGYTFVELGENEFGQDRLGDADVLEIFYGVVEGDTVFYVEEDAAAGFDLSGAAITTVTLTGVTEDLAISAELGFVGLAA